MQFLKTLFWMVVAVVLAAFTYRNWQGVPINLWGGLQAEVKMPVIVFGAFLLGFLPGFALYRTTRWRLRRRLESAERTLAEYRPVETVVTDGGPFPLEPLTAAPIPAPASAPPLVP
jgi:putative membrane protein